MLSRILLLLALVAVLAATTATNAKPTKQRAKLFPGSSKKAAKNPTQTFCQAFNAQCYLSALEQRQSSGGGAEVEVVYACRRNGKKYSKSYSFGCKADGVDITQNVLNKVGGGYTVTTTATPSVATATAPTSTITSAVSTSTVVTTSYTTTSTQLSLGTDPVPIVIVSVPNTPSSIRKRADRVDSSQFCSAFSAGCVKECARVSSTPKHTVCQAGSEGALTTQYKLACYCKNRKVETQHALRDTINQEHVATVFTVATSTSLITPLATTSVTATTTVTTKTASTTAIVLAATGAVQMVFASNSAPPRYIRKYDPNSNIIVYETDPDPALAQKFMAVRDPQSGLYSLRLADASGMVAVVEQYGPGDFGAGSSAYAGLEPGLSTSCGSNANKVGPPQPSGPSFLAGPCEVFVFGAQGDAQTLATGGTLNLAMEWVNAGQTTAKQYDWFTDDPSQNYHVGATGDIAAVNTAQRGFNIQKVTLRFPVTLP